MEELLDANLEDSRIRAKNIRLMRQELDVAKHEILDRINRLEFPPLTVISQENAPVTPMKLVSWGGAVIRWLFPSAVIVYEVIKHFKP